MTTASREEFAQLMNQERLRRHLSIRGAATLAGVPAATMQGWLNGSHLPTPALRPRFLAFIEVLGLTDRFDPSLWRRPRSA